jgi:hypothetical protein
MQYEKAPIASQAASKINSKNGIDLEREMSIRNAAIKPRMHTNKHESKQPFGNRRHRSLIGDEVLCLITAPISR